MACALHTISMHASSTTISDGLCLTVGRKSRIKSIEYRFFYGEAMAFFFHGLQNAPMGLLRTTIADGPCLTMGRKSRIESIKYRFCYGEAMAFFPHGLQNVPMGLLRTTIAYDLCLTHRLYANISVTMSLMACASHTISMHTLSITIADGPCLTVGRKVGSNQSNLFSSW